MTKMVVLSPSRLLQLFVFLSQTITSLMIQVRNISINLREDVRRVTRLNTEYRDTYVRRANEHAMNLMKEAIRLEM